MTRKFARLTRLIRDYRFYRGKGYKFKTAWNMARMTIP